MKLILGIGIAAAVVVALFFVLGGASLLASGPSPPDVDFQVFESTYPAINVGDKVTLKFNAVNNDPKSYAKVIVRLGSDNPDAEKYLTFDKGDITLGALGPAHEATSDASRDIFASDGVSDNPLKFRIRATLLVDDIKTDERTLDITINPK